MAEIFFNKPAGKYVVRLGTMPEHLGGAPGTFKPTSPPRLLCDETGKVRLFETYESAARAAHAN